MSSSTARVFGTAAATNAATPPSCRSSRDRGRARRKSRRRTDRSTTGACPAAPRRCAGEHQRLAALPAAPRDEARARVVERHQAGLESVLLEKLREVFAAFALATGGFTVSKRTRRDASSTDRSSSPSKVEHEPPRLRPRHTDHHRPVGGALVVGQQQIAVLAFAFQHPRLASAAHAVFAGGRHVDAVLPHDLQDGAIVRTSITVPVLRSSTSKLVARGLARAPEPLEMHGPGQCADASFTADMSPTGRSSTRGYRRAPRRATTSRRAAAASLNQGVTRSPASASSSRIEGRVRLRPRAIVQLPRSSFGESDRIMA